MGGYILIKQTSEKKLLGTKRNITYDKGINSPGRHNDSKYVCTKHQNLEIHEAERRSRQIDLSHHFHRVLEYATGFQGSNMEKPQLHQKSCRRKTLALSPCLWPLFSGVFLVFFSKSIPHFKLHSSIESPVNPRPSVASTQFYCQFACFQFHHPYRLNFRADFPSINFSYSSDHELGSLLTKNFK